MACMMPAAHLTCMPCPACCAPASCSHRAALPDTFRMRTHSRAASPGTRRSQPQRQQLRMRRLASHACRATSDDQSQSNGHADGVDAEEEDEGVLLPEEDWVVPGGANDSLSSNTQLGRAVQDACKELETLGGLEAETIQKANALLEKLGYRVVEEKEEGDRAQK